MPKKWVPTDGPALIARYEAGESVKALAQEEGVSRMPLRRYLERSGVTLRGIGEANEAQALRMTPEARKLRAEAAQRARRGQRDTPLTLERRALALQTNGARIGRSEAELETALKQRGFDTIPQLAVGRYNIDIAVGSVAVEVHSNGSLPHRLRRHRERVQELAGVGWHLVYVMGYPEMNLNAVTDEVEAHLHAVERDPDGTSRYVLVRRTGGLYPTTYDDIADYSRLQ